MNADDRRIAERIAWENMVRDTHFPQSRIVAGIALAEARRRGTLADVQRVALDYRRANLNRTTTLQRQWQTKVSRRPQRGRHHDSWTIREGYVRAHRWIDDDVKRGWQRWVNGLVAGFPGWKVYWTGSPLAGDRSHFVRRVK